MTKNEVKKAMKGTINSKSLYVNYEDIGDGLTWWVTEVVNSAVVNFWKVTYDDELDNYPCVQLQSSYREV